MINEQKINNNEINMEIMITEGHTIAMISHNSLAKKPNRLV